MDNTERYRHHKTRADAIAKGHTDRVRYLDEQARDYARAAYEQGLANEALILMMAEASSFNVNVVMGRRMAGDGVTGACY